MNEELVNRMKLLVARMQQEAEVELARFKQQKELESLESRRALLIAAKSEQTKEETLGKSRVDQLLDLELAKVKALFFFCFFFFKHLIFYCVNN